MTMGKTNQHQLPSEKSFGIFFGFVFALVAGYFIYAEKWAFSVALIVLAVALFALAYLRPVYLRWPNILWYKIGVALGAIVSPIVMGLIFFFLLTPVALLARVKGRDELSIRSNDRVSYWKLREENPSPDSFKNQY